MRGCFGREEFALPLRKNIALVENAVDKAMSIQPIETEQILGIRFFKGTANEAVMQMSQNGGLLVAPSGTCFERFLEDENYRRAITTADAALPDSGLMVLLWRRLRGPEHQPDLRHSRYQSAAYKPAFFT